MRAIYDIRRSNIKKPRDDIGGNSFFATMTDREPAQTNRSMEDGVTKDIGGSVARYIERCPDLPVGWLDQEYRTTNITKKPDTPITNKRITLVPVISWVQAGVWEEVGYSEVDLGAAETYPCPAPCGEMTYILQVIGDSMIDEYRPGDMIFADPEVPACHGDDVTTLVHDTGGATLKRLTEDETQRYPKVLNPN